MATDTGPGGASAPDTAPDNAPEIEGEDPTEATAPPASNWGPTRASSALVLLLVGAAVVGFVASVGLAGPTALAVLGGALLALALWAVGRERFRFPATVLANLALVPVGGCLLGAVAGAVLVQYGGVFPVDSPAEVVAPALRIAVEALAVGAVAVAALGAFTTVGDTVSLDTLRACHSQALRMAMPPVLAGFGLGLLAVLSSPTVGPTLDPLAALGDVFGVAARLALSPEPTDLAIGPFLALLGLSAVGFSRLVAALPAEEFATAREGSEVETPLAPALLRVAGLATPVGTLLLGLSLVVTSAEAVLGPPGLRAALGGVGGLAGSLASAPPLRALLVGFLLLVAAVVGTVDLLRRTVRESTSDLFVGYVPFAVGAGVVLLAFTLEGTVLPTAIPTVAANLGGFGDPFASLATGVVEFYGGGVVVSALFGVASLLAVGVVSLLWVVRRLGLVTERSAGPTLAAVGLLVAAGFGTAVGHGPALAIGGVAAALLVRDVGTYGTTLGRELGRAAPTRRTELVHAVGAGLVAVLGVGVATAAARTAGVTALALPVPVGGPLLAAAVALVLLVLILR